MSTPRTWKLTGSHPRRVTNERIEPRLEPGESVEVIEAEPVLDLLKRLRGVLNGKLICEPVEDELDALLREHDRLGPDGV